jgi:hypothetical protein
MAGKVIWDKRRHLDGFLNPLNENPFTNAITTQTQIEITTEERPITGKEPGGTGRPSVSDGTAGMSDDPEGVDYSVQIDTRPSHALPAPLRMRTVTRDVARHSANPEAFLYARVAFLFFLALLITWVPSSVNRVYALANPNVMNFAINYAASFVFPLQGFWNVIVYIITSQTACRALFSRATRRASHPSSRLTGSISENGPKYRLKSISSLP